MTKIQWFCLPRGVKRSFAKAEGYGHIIRIYAQSEKFFTKTFECLPDASYFSILARGRADGETSSKPQTSEKKGADFVLKANNFLYPRFFAWRSTYSTMRVPTSWPW